MKIEICHTTPGLQGTRISTDVTFDVVPAYKEISFKDIDFNWVSGGNIHEVMSNLSRILRRMADGIDEGPGTSMQIMFPPIIKINEVDPQSDLTIDMKNMD